MVPPKILHQNFFRVIQLFSFRLYRDPELNDGDVNEDGKKAIGLDWQNNNFSCVSRLFVHLFAVTARLRRENA